MAVIDIRNCDIFVEDGFAVAGAVNNASGYTTGATTMAIDGVTKALAAGAHFLITGQTTDYTVVSTVGGATPTSVTFTPALTGAAADNAVITFGPNRLEVKVGEGNLSYTEKRKYKYIRNKGRLDTVQRDDEETIEVSLEFTWEYLSSSTGDPPTVEEALKRTGAAAGWVNSATDPCTPYAVNIRVLNIVPCADFDNEQVLLRDFRHESLEHSIRDGRVSIKGQCNITEAEVSRVPK